MPLLFACYFAVTSQNSHLFSEGWVPASCIFPVLYRSGSLDCRFGCGTASEDARERAYARPSTSFSRREIQDVDARHKAGHDDSRPGRGDDDGITLGLEGDLEPAGASEQPGIEWLDRVGVDGTVLGSALQQSRHGMRNASIGSGREDAEAHALAFPDRIDRERATARDGLVGDDQQIEQQLDPVFRQQAARQIPDELGLLSFDEGQRHRLRVAEFDLGGKRASRAEGKTAELQPRRGRLRAPLDEVKGESLGLRVAAFLLQHLEPVDDRPGGADQVMANARAQEGREIERIKCDGYGHGGRLRWRIGGAVSGGGGGEAGSAAPGGYF